MKRILTLCTALCLMTATYAQSDSTRNSNTSDPIRIGGMIIIKKAGSNSR